MSNKVLIVVLGVLLLAGCATTPPASVPAPVETSNTNAPKPVVPDDVRLPNIEEESPVVQAPRIEAKKAEVLREKSQDAVSQLLLSAKKAQSLGNHRQAIAIAERALRINRYHPEAYLILARSHTTLGSRNLAVQFARRGLQYADKDDMIKALKGML